MEQAYDQGVRGLIEETNYAFSYCRGSLNTDYAEFAALSLRDFKYALRRPEMTSIELVSLLRDASHAYKTADPEGCWITFLAHYIERGKITTQ